MNGAPDWQDGECCFRCRTQFTLVARKHHCRNCGNIFCAKCSSQQIPLPKLNIEKNVRVCDGCFEKLNKDEDSTAPALDNNKSPHVDSVKLKSASTKSANGSIEPTTSASAPSEQELKEEEEFQIALALSLSEAPAKVHFPDCKQLEHSSTAVTSLAIDQESTDNEQQQQQQPPPPIKSVATNQHPQDNAMLETDQELFRFVADVQSTSEVFTNRVNSSKSRNRPIANDSAIQGLFMKLTNMHTKLLEYIAQYEGERAGYETLQDKLTQITDSRAALDALREEHQEKMRQEAAEIERQRKNQLALKLETMREKKSQMMQYQREVALQRIQAQEKSQTMQYQGEVTQHHPQPQEDIQTMQYQSAVPQQQHLQPQEPQQNPPRQQSLGDDALLISFDD